MIASYRQSTKSCIYIGYHVGRLSTLYVHIMLDNWKSTQIQILTYQTRDKKNIYKVADISKIINCTTSTSTTTTTPESLDLASVLDENKNEIEILEPIVQREKLIQYPHGITAPMKYARKRIFRKTRKMRYMDAQLEKELKKLLRSDLDATSIEWEVIEDDDLAAPSSTIHLDHPSSSLSHTIENVSGAIDDSEAFM